MTLLFNETAKRDHWRGRSRRVKALVDSGYLRAHKFTYKAPVFGLTEKGHGALEQAGLARLPGFRRRISESMATHEVMVAGVGLVIGEVLGLEVLTARERVEWKGRGGRPPTDCKTIPDLWVADDAEPKGVELERGPKAKEEYRARWLAARLNLPDNGLLLYLTTWPGGKRFILELAEDYRAQFVLAASLEEFIAAGGRCRFTGYASGRVLVLRSRLGAAYAPPPQAGPAVALDRSDERPYGPGVQVMPAPRSTGGMDQ